VEKQIEKGGGLDVADLRIGMILGGVHILKFLMFS